MNDFWNKYFNIKKMMEGKREYRLQMARVKSLPKDYQYVYKKIQEQTWGSVTGDGYDMLELHYGLLDLFEEGAAEGKPVLEITGEDVATFVDELLRNVKADPAAWRGKFNRDICNKVADLRQKSYDF